MFKYVRPKDTLTKYLMECQRRWCSHRDTTGTVCPAQPYPPIPLSVYTRPICESHLEKHCCTDALNQWLVHVCTSFWTWLPMLWDTGLRTVVTLPPPTTLAASTKMCLLLRAHFFSLIYFGKQFPTGSMNKRHGLNPSQKNKYPKVKE